jgi:hypothetical protein
MKVVFRGSVKFLKLVYWVAVMVPHPCRPLSTFNERVNIDFEYFWSFFVSKVLRTLNVFAYFNHLEMKGVVGIQFFKKSHSLIFK